MNRDAATGVARFPADLRRGSHAKVRQNRHRNLRPVISMVLLVIDLVALGVTVGGVHGPVRFIFGVTLGLFIPGWSVVGLLKLDSAPLEFALTVGASLAILVVAAQILMSVHAWHLFALEVVICLVCLPSLVFQSRGLGQSTDSK